MHKGVFTALSGMRVGGVSSTWQLLEWLNKWEDIGGYLRVAWMLISLLVSEERNMKVNWPDSICSHSHWYAVPLAYYTRPATLAEEISMAVTEMKRCLTEPSPFIDPSALPDAPQKESASGEHQHHQLCINFLIAYLLIVPQCLCSVSRKFPIRVIICPWAWFYEGLELISPV